MDLFFSLSSDKKELYLTSKSKFMLKLGHYKDLAQENTAFNNDIFCKQLIHSLEHSPDPLSTMLINKAASHLKSRNSLDKDTHHIALIRLKLVCPV